MEIIDNFLPEEVFEDIYKGMFSYGFPWYYMDSLATVEDTERAFLCHGFYADNEAASQYFKALNPVIQQLPDLKSLVRIKANLYYPSEVIQEHGWHKDFHYSHKGLLLYMNSNNGYTEIEGEGKIDSKRNRAVIFDPGVLHRSTNCTDKKFRSSIIFNYL